MFRKQKKETGKSRLWHGLDLFMDVCMGKPVPISPAGDYAGIRLELQLTRDCARSVPEDPVRNVQLAEWLSTADHQEVPQ